MGASCRKGRIRSEAYPGEHRHTIAVYKSARTFEETYDIVTLIFLDLHSSQAIVTFCLFGLGAPERSSGVCGTEFGVEFVSLMFVLSTRIDCDWAMIPIGALSPQGAQNPPGLARARPGSRLTSESFLLANCELMENYPGGSNKFRVSINRPHSLSADQPTKRSLFQLKRLERLRWFQSGSKFGVRFR